MTSPGSSSGNADTGKPRSRKQNVRFVLLLALIALLILSPSGLLLLLSCRIVLLLLLTLLALPILLPSGFLLSLSC